MTILKDDQDEILLNDLGVYELERRVKELLALVDRLRDDNHKLKAKQSQLLAERAELVDRHEAVCSKVESLLGKIRELEQV